MGYGRNSAKGANTDTGAAYMDTDTSYTVTQAE